MKKSFLIVCALVICALTGYAQQANIFASGLKLEQVEGNTYKFHYTLNADAQSGSINLIPAQGEPIVLPCPEAALLTKGAHTVTIPLDVPNGTYTWSVTATGAATAADPVKISNDDSKFKFYMPTGLAVDNNFGSPSFGHIYVSEGMGSSIEAATPDYFGDGRVTNDGIYVFDATLTALNTETYAGGVSWSSNDNFAEGGRSPGRLSIDAAGKVYIADNSTTNAGIYIMDPVNPTANFTSVFTGSLDEAGLASNHGRIPALCVEGSGESTVLYTIDRNYLPEGQDARAYLPSGMIFKYENIATPVAVQPTLVYDNAASYLANDAMGLAADGRGGFWVSQNRNTDAASIPSLSHVTAAGVIDYRSKDGTNVDLGNSARGVVALNADKTLLGVSSNKGINVYAIAYDPETGIPTLTLVTTVTIGATNMDGVAFDVADNLYIVSASSERFYQYALPKAENTFTTPAPAASTITVEGIVPPPPAPSIQLTTLFTKADYSWNTGNASRDAAMYDGKVYAIDNSGKIHVIDGATGEEDASALITNTNLQCFSVASDGAGKLYVPSNNTAGNSAFGISVVDLLNANAVTALTYAGETGTVGDGKRSDYIEVYKADATTTYIAGPSTNTTPHLRIWSTDGTTVTTPIVSTDINYKADATINNNNTGGNVTWIDATHLIATGQGNIPQYVTIDPVAGTATHEPIGTATTAFGGSAYFVWNSVPYLVLTDGGYGAIKVLDISDKTAPVEIASAPAIGSVTNATIHVGIEAFVADNAVTIHVWSPNNGLAAHKLTVGGTDNIPAVAADPAVTITVKSYELEIKTGGAQLAGYALYGIDGRPVRSGKTGGTSATIATGNLPQGVYVLQVTTSEGTVAKKFIKR
ncbi:MAG: T9SS type A sorting domain-containing protein [Dysgonamonadaceae bacterium]|nr:T9SS type A sorting domain-containing protein [Dysgonamonadaceae bacterium]